MWKEPVVATFEAKTFGEMVRRYRRRAGLTQEELAERAEITSRGLAYLERGERSPQPGTIRRLSQALDLSPEEHAALLRLAEGAAGLAAPTAASRSPAVSTQVRTFLIADVRGYTRFTAERGDEAAARLAARFAGLCREIVPAHEGAVVELRGDEALAVFSSARAALRAAIDLQKQFAAATAAEPDLPLRVGIGLDAGEAIPLEAGYRGAALNLAARLCGLAGPGEVLASEGIAYLARKTEGLAYVDRGPVELKGFIDPVGVVQVVAGGEAAEGQSAATDVAPSWAETALPIGGFVGSLPSGAIVARDDELATIMAAVDAAAGGTGQLLLLAGPRGVGKSRLAQEATRMAHQGGFLIAAGRCYEPEREVSLFPFLEALSMAYNAAPSTVRFQVPRRWQHLAGLLPGEVPTPTPDPSADALEEQQRVIRAVTGFLNAIAQERPVALLFDDLHWADEASLRLLSHLARQTRGRRVFILGTYCDTQLSASPALDRTIRDLSRERLAERVTVRRLTAEGTAAMVAATVGDVETSEEFTEFVHRRTKGIPFFIEEMLRSVGGHYRLIREIGAGGMGRVFQAVDTRTGKVVAAKIMFTTKEASSDAALRFEQEGAVLASLQHPNIVEVYGTFMQEHASCIIMELLEGGSLAEVLRTEQLDLARIRTIAQQVASALASAHRKGIVHRDVKPDNIMVLERDCVKVTDFGIARVLRPEATIHTMTSTGMTLGTPLYASPEQIDGRKADGRADVYSLGVVLYRMLTGHPPFEGTDPLTVAFKHVNEQPLPPSKVRPGIPKDWEALILKALAKDPGDRFQSATAMGEAIGLLSSDDAGALARTEAPRRSLLRVLTPPARPRQTRAERAAGAAVAAPLPEVYEGEERAATAAVRRGGLPQRLTRNPLAWGGAAVTVVLAFVILFALHLTASSGTSKLRAPSAVWGTQATLSGKLSAPDGVAVDGQGNVYVADQTGDFIQKLSSDGRPLDRWGSAGAGPGKFSGPAALAIDRQGNVLVADTGNNRVQELSPTGVFVKQWGGGTSPQLSSPLGVAVDGQGNVYVDDSANGAGRILKLSADGRVLFQVQTGLGFPNGLAVGNGGDIYVADGSNNRIAVFSPRGRLLARWPLKGSPTGLAVETQGNIYVADQVDGTVQQLSPSGTILATLVGKGPRPGQVQDPQAVAVDAHGRIYVADEGNHRIQVLSSNGRPLARWTATGRGVLHFNQPTGLALVNAGGHASGVFVSDSPLTGASHIDELTPGGVPAAGWRPQGLGSGPFQFAGIATDRHGTVYVADQVNGVLKLSSSGKLLAHWSVIAGYSRGALDAPKGVAVDARGNVYLADTYNDDIVELSPRGTYEKQWGTPGSGPNEFNSPVAVVVDSHGDVYVVDDLNDNIQKLSPTDQVLGIWGGHGSRHREFKSPAALALDGQGNVYVADKGNNRIQELSGDGAFIRQWGTTGSAPGQFRSPSGIAIDPQGNIYVADAGNHRIQRFAPPR